MTTQEPGSATMPPSPPLQPLPKSSSPASERTRDGPRPSRQRTEMELVELAARQAKEHQLLAFQQLQRDGTFFDRIVGRWIDAG